MKIIFLDHDGVICLSDQYGGRFKKAKRYFKENPEVEFGDRPVSIRFDNFDKKSIKILNEILEESSAEIVVSSDWKLHATLEELGEYYESQGIIKKPIATTPNLSEFSPDTHGLFHWKRWLERIRILEIEKYLEFNPEITHWVAIDDLDMGEKFGNISGNSNGGLTNFVLTPKEREGIKQSGIKEKVISFLT